jgi:hypothetical protein
MCPLRTGMILPQLPCSPSYLRLGTPALAVFLQYLGHTTGEFGMLASYAKFPPLQARCRAEASRHHKLPPQRDRKASNA